MELKQLSKIALGAWAWGSSGILLMPMAWALPRKCKVSFCVARDSCLISDKVTSQK